MLLLLLYRQCFLRQKSTARNRSLEIIIRHPVRLHCQEMLFLVLPFTMRTLCLFVLGKVVLQSEKRNYFTLNLLLLCKCASNLALFAITVVFLASTGHVPIEELFSDRPAWGASADFNTESKSHPPGSVYAVQTMDIKEMTKASGNDCSSHFHMLSLLTLTWSPKDLFCTHLNVSYKFQETQTGQEILYLVTVHTHFKQFSRVSSMVEELPSMLVHSKQNESLYMLKSRKA